MVRLPHVETNITTACQLRCVGCNHYVSIQKAHYADPEVIRRDVYNLSRIAHVDKYAVIGGEPLLHKRLVEILRIIRESGIATQIEVWTNGLKVREMGADFWGAFDILVVSAYPGKMTDEDIDEIRMSCAVHGVDFQIKDARHSTYFTKLLYKTHATDEQAAAVWDGCWYRTYTRVLDNGYFYRCCTSPFIPKLILDLPEGTDGIEVDGLTEAGLVEFLERKTPMASCYRCAGHNAGHIQWRETTRAEWLKESAHDR